MLCRCLQKSSSRILYQSKRDARRRSTKAKRTGRWVRSFKFFGNSEQEIRADYAHNGMFKRGLPTASEKLAALKDSPNSSKHKNRWPSSTSLTPMTPDRPRRPPASPLLWRLSVLTSITHPTTQVSWWGATRAPLTKRNKRRRSSPAIPPRKYRMQLLWHRKTNPINCERLMVRAHIIKKTNIIAALHFSTECRSMCSHDSLLACHDS